jgi:hypothetical protein
MVDNEDHACSVCCLFSRHYWCSHDQRIVCTET